MKRDINDRIEFQTKRPSLIRYLDNMVEEIKGIEIPDGKKVLLIRWGAIGDMVFVSPLPRLLKEQGYYVVVNCQRPGLIILQHNPYIDEFWFQESKAIDPEKYEPYWNLLGEGFDKVINLTQSVEGDLLQFPSYMNSMRERKDDREDDNFIDYTLEFAGFKERGLKAEIYFSEAEEIEAKKFLENFQDKFVVIVVLMGSSISKAYPWWPFIFNETTLYKDMPELLTITTGDEWGRLLEWDHPNNIKGSSTLSVRKSVLLAKYANLIIGPDTGIINGAGAFDVPKICLLGQTSKNNITKYWENDYSIQAPSKCSPCYRIVYHREQCRVDPVTHGNICMKEISPDMVITQIKKVYKKWKRDKYLRIVTPSEYYQERTKCQPLVIL